MRGIGYYYTEAKGIEVVVTRGQAQDYPWHMHTRHWTMGVIGQGALWLTTERASQRLCQGQQFCLPPYVAHSLRVEAESSLFVLCCDAQGALELQKSPEALLRGVSCFESQDLQGMEKIIAACTQHDFPCDVFENVLPHSDALLGLSLRESMRLILAQPDEALGIEQMAAHAGYSPWYFLRTFQKMTGMTPHAFQILCRVRFARSLLRAGTAASTAAVTAGFADQSHMHKVFKRHHGMTPGEFKKASVRLEL